MASKKKLYREAKKLTENTGVKHHVDHIKSKKTGGDDSVANLQVVTAKDNLTKASKEKGTYKPIIEKIFDPKKNLVYERGGFMDTKKMLNKNKKTVTKKTKDKATSTAPLDPRDNIRQSPAELENRIAKLEQQLASRRMDEGGLLQEGGTVDPVSGNEVPIGSTKSEVRDDIPAQLSEGEFVFPADVVRFIGLNNLMKLRQEAKEGLNKMDRMGQMGNADEAVEDDRGEFDTDIDGIISEVEKEMNEKQTMSSQDKPKEESKIEDFLN